MKCTSGFVSSSSFSFSLTALSISPFTTRCSCQQLDMDKDRTKRTEEEMADEAALLARYFDHSNTSP